MNHDNLAISDKLSLLGELEHLRAHLVRSAHSSEDGDKKFFYLVKAEQTKKLRRKLQAKWLSTGELDWCSVKVGSRIKQLNLETLSDDLDLFSEVESLADSVLGEALGIDLSGCVSCRGDKEDT